MSNGKNIKFSSSRELKPKMSLRELNPMSTSIQNELLDQNISNSLETRDHLQVTWKLERTNEMSAFQKLLPNFGEHPNYMHFYLDHGEIQEHEMILNFIFESGIWSSVGMVSLESSSNWINVSFGPLQKWIKIISKYMIIYTVSSKRSNGTSPR